MGFLSLASGAFGVMSAGLTVGNAWGTLFPPERPAEIAATMPAVAVAPGIVWTILVLSVVRMGLTTFLALCGIATLNNDRRAYRWHWFYAPTKIAVTLAFAVALISARMQIPEASVNWGATMFGVMVSGGYAVVLLGLLRLESVRGYYRGLGVKVG
jgi:hypothetical protein